MNYRLFAALLAVAALAAAQDSGPITSFETATDNPFRAVGNALVQRVERHAAEGRFSLRVELKGAATDTWPGLTLPADNQGDWSRRETLDLDIFLEGDTPTHLSTRFDAEGKPGIFGGAPLKPGWNKGWSVNLKALRAESDLAHAKSLLLYASKPRADVVLYLDNVRWGSFQARFKRLEYLETRPRPEPSAAEQQRGFIAWGHAAQEPVFQVNRPAGRLDSLRLFLAKDELEPVAFSVYALRDLPDLSVSVGDLRGPDGAAIAAAAWEVRQVRYLDKRVTYSSDQYVHAFPAYLAPAAPLAVSADHSQTFQLILRGPAAAAPGTYRGTVTLSADGQRQEFPVEVLLLPWQLPEAKGLLYGEYYRLLGGTANPRERIRADLADMRRQGMTSVGLCFGIDPGSYTRDGEAFTFQFKGDTRFDEFMAAYVELGFPGALILLSDSGQGAAAPLGAIGTPAFDRAYVNFHTALAAALKAKGWPELYVQPVDEPGWQGQADRERNVALLKLLKAAGIKTEEDGPGDDYFHNEAGPFSDLWNYNGALANAGITDKARRDGRLITFYNNDVESYRPEVDRWAYGLFNWFWGMHGGYNWEYRGGSGDLYDNLDAQHGDWVHYYLPQGDEPGGPSTGWEGCREGIDDRRYLLLAEHLIERASKAVASREVAAEAHTALADLRARLDTSPRVRSRAGFTATLSPDQAKQRGLLVGTPGATAYVTGSYKHPNNLQFREYDTVRWLVARQCWGLLHALGEAPPLPPPAAIVAAPPPERLTVVGREAGPGPQTSPRPALRLPQLAAAPLLDGSIDGDPAWTAAAQVELALSDGSGPAEMPTQVRLGLHADILYVAFTCAETQTESMVASCRTPDGDVWKDDCVEVFLDPGLTGKTFCQVIVNSLGTVARSGRAGTAWKPAVRAAAKVEKEQRRWLVELAIPVADLKLAPRFGLNLARERRPLEVLELSAWSPTGGSFSQPERFGIAVVDGDLPAAVAARTELGLEVSPGYSLTTSADVDLTLRLGLAPAELAKATLSLTVEGPAGRVETQVPAPLAPRLLARLATADLPAGTYLVSARLQGVAAPPPAATARFTRIVAPW